MNPKLLPILCTFYLLGMIVQAQEAPWQWSWEKIHSVISQVRAGKDLTPPAWPGAIEWQSRSVLIWTTSLPRFETEGPLHRRYPRENTAAGPDSLESSGC